MEWQLVPRLFNRFHSDRRFGPFSVDAFATRVNCQIPRFWSRYADPDSPQSADAFKHLWTHENLWLCPPPALIPRVLNKMEQDKCSQVTLVAPHVAVAAVVAAGAAALSIRN
eukprot:SAG31_NODE_34236_length_335_cov_0.792373_1_plen_111_part_11